MFIEINDISTGTVVNEPLNAYSINYVYGRQNDSGKYNLIYVLNNGIRKIEEFNSQSDLEDKLEEIRDLSGGGGAVANVYTYKGSCTFENLPASGNVVGDVWNITDDFELGGKSYPAGTNVAWDGTGWDALAGSIDLSNYYTKTEVDSLVSGALSFRGVYPNATNNPFVLQGKETGIYLICHTGNSPQNGPYFKATSSTNLYNLNLTAPIGMYFLIKDYDSAAQSAEEIIGYFYSYENEFGSTTVNLVGQISTMVKLTNGNIISRAADTKSTGILRNILVSDKQQEITAKKQFNVIPILKNGLTPTTDMELVNKKYVDDTRETIQYSTMPTADSSNADRIVEYVGTTDANYTNGYFYKNIYTPASTYNLTEQQALDGINNVSFSSSVVLAAPIVGDGQNLYLEGDQTCYINAQYSEGDDYAPAQISIMVYDEDNDLDIDVVYQNDSSDGVTFNMVDYQYATSYNLSQTISLAGTWYDEFSPFIETETPGSYNWQQINVQPASDMSNYYTKAEIDSMLGDIQTVLETLTLPTAVEEELSEI